MSKWQPIETAPKDGTDVLLARTDDEGSYWTAIGQWWVWNWAFMHMKDSMTPVLLDFQPTHWMPLPEPPKE